MIEHYSPQNEAIKLAQNTTEYAYNSSTTITNDTASFAYGEEGALIQSFAPEGLAGVSKYVQFKSKIQPTDMLFLELYNPNGKAWYSPLDTVWSQNDAATVYYGWRILIINENTVNVVFASRYSKETSSTWAILSTAGFRWRVRKVSAGNLSEVIAEKQTVTVTGNYSLPVGVKTVNVNASTATITINGLNNGEQVTVRKLSAYDGNAITITPPSGATIEGLTQIELYGQYSFVELERISATVFAVKDLKDEYVWDSGTGARVRRRWGQLSEKEIIGTTAATVNAAVSAAHGLDLTKIVSATGMVKRVAVYSPMPYVGYGDFSNTVSFYISTTDVYVLNSTVLNEGYFSQQYVVEIRYREW